MRELGAPEPASPPVSTVRVVAVGFRPGPFLVTPGEITTVDHDEEGRIERLVDAVAQGIEAAGAVVVVYPRWDGGGIGHDLDTVRSLLQTSRLVALPLDLSPLAGSVMSSLVAGVVTVAGSAGRVVALVPALEGDLHSLAWLGSLARLARPAPSMAQHLAAWWPGTSFSVGSWYEPSLRRVGSGGGVPFPPGEGPSGVALASRDGDGAAWLRQAVRGHGPVVETEAHPRFQQYWGTVRVSEAVAYPLSPERLVERALPELRLLACPWCGEEVATAVCPFCRMARDEPAMLPSR